MVGSATPNAATGLWGSGRSAGRNVQTDFVTMAPSAPSRRLTGAATLAAAHSHANAMGASRPEANSADPGVVAEVPRYVRKPRNGDPAGP